MLVPGKSERRQLFKKGKAYKIKFNDREFRNNNYKKFTETYPAFPLNCISLILMQINTKLGVINEK